MDIGWVVFFVLILIVSSIMNKKAEAKKKAEAEQAKAAGRKVGPSSSPSTPVAPGPFGPRGAAPTATRPEARRTVPSPAARSDDKPAAGAGRSIFDEMRRELAQAMQAEPEHRPEPKPEPVAVRHEAERPQPVSRPDPVAETRDVEAPPTPNASEPVLEGDGRRRRRSFSFTRSSLRHAFVMAEILKPPVALDE